MRIGSERFEHRSRHAERVPVVFEADSSFVSLLPPSADCTAPVSVKWGDEI